MLATFLISQSPAQNWPGFRGPGGSGKPDAPTDVPLEWSESKNVKWKLELPGPGSSSPIVWGDRVFITAYSGYGDGSNGEIEQLTRHLLAVDKETGRVIWQSDIPISNPDSEDPFQGFINEHGYASHTPVTDGQKIYCFFGKGGVVAFDWEGNTVWRKEVGQLHSQKRWGSASSPVLVDGKLIVKAGDEARAVYAFDAASGKEIWKAEGSVLEQTYGTPAVHRVDDTRTDLIVASPGEIWGMNPETGKLRWLSETQILGNVSSSPVVEGDMMVIFGGFPRTMGAALKLGLTGDVSDSARIWENVDVKAYMTAPLFHEGLLYFIRDEGVACCADPVKGELLYEERISGASGQRGRGKPFYASPVLIQGHIVAVSRTAGTFIIEAKPEYKLVRVNKIEGDAGRFQGTPAVSGNRLFLRSETALYCIGQ
ncbi:MAG: PQQ-binding-like beta-propeller repeat protein [Verrucomicrobiales bacterium]|nr:PQQ-binding-like beta-propeller repeat protein [Verrucomicrobiales bacterium]